MCLRVDAGRPIAHVAAGAGISRRCLSKWYARWRAHGENGLLDHSSRPAASPARTPEDIADAVETLRRQTKHGSARLAIDLQRLHGITVAPATVHRILVRRGLNRLRDLDPPTGEQLREVIRYEHDRVGDLVHVDVKKLGRIPTGGGRRMHGITPIRRCLTDNGVCYRSTTWADALAATGTKHKRTRPYTPRTNGTVERYNGTLTREWAYVRDCTTEHERGVALAEFVNYHNHERPHAALTANRPSAGPPVATAGSSSTSRPNHSRISHSSSPSRTSCNQRPETPQLAALERLALLRV